MLFDIFKRGLHFLLGDYQCWIVYHFRPKSRPVTPVLPEGIEIRPIVRSHFDGVGDKHVMQTLAYADDCALGLALYVNGDLAAVYWAIWGAHYENMRKGRSWHIEPDSAKLVGAYTLPQHRGRGYLPILFNHLTEAMWMRGFAHFYSRIWHSNRSAIRMACKTGRRRVGVYIEFYILKKRIELRIPLPSFATV